ncbi:hypothetical protein H696_00970 [Fonticula alba]|uniref:Uncharacterized protein n=1 Tax=Fonticula alba TaxID=691883 RepID=A0A058ZHL3_FONAL|nr:hypothetical protein H696_00970 [Fonticula alba]KCV73433.1 hypothetical protein H696_00970 [Fonticula alba]|eukprot:XP_009493134.1 hypothetical protein H696_00970 [Fonticula alba]
MVTAPFAEADVRLLLLLANYVFPGNAQEWALVSDMFNAAIRGDLAQLRTLTDIHRPPADAEVATASRGCPPPSVDQLEEQARIAAGGCIRSGVALRRKFFRSVTESERQIQRGATPPPDGALLVRISQVCDLREAQLAGSQSAPREEHHQAPATKRARRDAASTPGPESGPADPSPPPPLVPMSEVASGQIPSSSIPEGVQDLLNHLSSCAQCMNSRPGGGQPCSAIRLLLSSNFLTSVHGGGALSASAPPRDSPPVAGSLDSTVYMLSGVAEAKPVTSSHGAAGCPGDLVAAGAEAGLHPFAPGPVQAPTASPLGQAIMEMAQQVASLAREMRELRQEMAALRMAYRAHMSKMAALLQKHRHANATAPAAPVAPGYQGG